MATMDQSYESDDSSVTIKPEKKNDFIDEFAHLTEDIFKD
jgi:hypothetical protein